MDQKAPETTEDGIRRRGWSENRAFGRRKFCLSESPGDCEEGPAQMNRVEPRKKDMAPFHARKPAIGKSAFLADPNGRECCAVRKEQSVVGNTARTPSWHHCIPEGHSARRGRKTKVTWYLLTSLLLLMPVGKQKLVGRLPGPHPHDLDTRIKDRAPGC